MGNEDIAPRILNLGDMWKWVVSWSASGLPSGKEVGWNPEPVLTRWRKKKSLPLPEVEPRSYIP